MKPAFPQYFRWPSAVHGRGPNRVLGLALFCLGLWLVPGLQAAAPAGTRILVLNTDSSVEKYAEVQNAFKLSVKSPTIDVDLAKQGEARLRRVLASENPAAVYCIGGKAYQAATRVAKDKPIILSSTINWQRFPARKQTLVIANEIPATAQLTLFRHFFPKLQRVGVLYNRDINKEWFAQAVAAGQEVGCEILGRPVRRTADVAAAVKELSAQVDAIWLTPDPVVLADARSVKLLFERCHAAQKPVFAYAPAFGELGAVMIIAPDMPTIGRQAAGLALDLGGHPEPVNHPAGTEITLNLTRVKQYGLELNPDALDSVNQLIR